MLSCIRFQRRGLGVSMADQNEAEQEQAPEPSEPDPQTVKRGVNKVVLITAIVLVAVAIGGVFGVFYFIESERARDHQAWQIRLGIVADSRAAAVRECLPSWRHRPCRGGDSNPLSPSVGACAQYQFAYCC